MGWVGKHGLILCSRPRTILIDRATVRASERRRLPRLAIQRLLVESLDVVGQAYFLI